MMVGGDSYEIQLADGHGRQDCTKALVLGKIGVLESIGFTDITYHTHATT